MANLLHVTGTGRQPLPAFEGHLVRNLDRDRFSPGAADDVDVVVVSATDAADAAGLVADLRTRRVDLDVVLLVDGSPGWQSVAGAFARVTLCTGGIPALRRVLGSTVRPGPPRSSHLDGVDAADAADVVDLRRLVPRGGQRTLLRDRLAAGGRRSAPAPEVLPPVPPEVATDVRSADRPDVPIGPALLSRRARRHLDDPDSHVTALLAAVGRLGGVAATAGALAQELVDVTGAEAVAVVLADDEQWAVVALHDAADQGQGQLPVPLPGLRVGHWLVDRVGRAGQPHLLGTADPGPDDRSRLVGVPLSGRAQLMLVPLPSRDGLVVLARDADAPFDGNDLAAAEGCLRAAAPALTAALRLRALARRLTPFAEPTPVTGPAQD